MSWDPIWEKVYQQRGSWGMYPPEELIRYIANNYCQVANKNTVKILEIGSGVGANIWFLSKEGFDVHGIDGSKTAVKINNKLLVKEKLKANIVIGDFKNIPWKDNYFDCVIDVCSLECNSTNDTKDIISEIFRVLKKGGHHFSMTVSTGSWGYRNGDGIDRYTYKNVKNGPFKNMGILRFATLNSIKSLYRNFSKISIESSSRTYKNRKHIISHWIISCVK